MDKKEILEKLKEILADQLSVDAETVEPDASIMDDLGADSLDVVEMLMAIEDNFGIEIPDTEAPNLKTVNDVIEYIANNK